MTTATMEQTAKASRDSAALPASRSPSLEHYLGLQYRIELVEDEGAWVASNPDLPGCATFGPDPGAAVKNLADVRRLWIEGQIESGNKIPEPPADERFSGKFVLRIPKSLHRLAEMRSRSEGVSLNALITNILAGALGFGGRSQPLATETGHRHAHLWHRTLAANETSCGWSAIEAAPAPRAASGKGVYIFLDHVASGLATHHRSAFNPSKEYYRAEEKRLAQK